MAKKTKKIKQEDYQNDNEMMKDIKALIKQGTAFTFVPKPVSNDAHRSQHTIVIIKYVLQGINELVAEEWKDKIDVVISEILQDDDVLKFLKPTYRGTNPVFNEGNMMLIVAKMQEKGVYKNKNTVSDRAFETKVNERLKERCGKKNSHLHEAMGNSNRYTSMPSEVVSVVTYTINKNV